ncbi:MAG: cyclic nucleotide-binding domain-containing protein [Ilumatobacter sp.]|nr:cyclic nucleotide-binding domain-containing protein [Ilumatobacter sp.]
MRPLDHRSNRPRSTALALRTKRRCVASRATVWSAKQHPTTRGPTRPVTDATILVKLAPALRVGSRNMASMKQQLESLRGVTLFSACTNKELEKVAKATDKITMTAGTMVMDQGQMGREAFVVVAGNVIVRRNGRQVATLGAGNVVGEMSLLDKGPRTATVVCETDCTLIVIDQRRFLAVVDSIPAISHKLMASLAGRIRELDRQYYG